MGAIEVLEIVTPRDDRDDIERQILWEPVTSLNVSVSAVGPPELTGVRFFSDMNRIPLSCL